jgi:hypothetical protein
MNEPIRIPLENVYDPARPFKHPYIELTTQIIAQILGDVPSRLAKLEREMHALPCPICTMPMDDEDGGCVRHDPDEIAAWTREKAQQPDQPCNPCPFCGGSATFDESDVDEYGQAWDRISCTSCYAYVEIALNKDGSGSNVLERWNSRVQFCPDWNRQCNQLREVVAQRDDLAKRLEAVTQERNEARITLANGRATWRDTLVDRTAERDKALADLAEATATIDYCRKELVNAGCDPGESLESGVRNIIADIDALKRHGMSEVLFCNDAEEVEYEDKMLDLHAKACAHVHEMSARNDVGVLREAQSLIGKYVDREVYRGAGGQQMRQPTDLEERIDGVLAKNGEGT